VVVESGPPAQVLANPAEARARQHRPRANVTPCRVARPHLRLCLTG
jgi:hypothetical protein